MVYEKKIFLMSSLEWRNFSSQGNCYSAYQQSQSFNIAWCRVPMIKGGTMKKLSTHFYLNNAGSNTVEINIAGSPELLTTFTSSQTGLIETEADVLFNSGDNICLVNRENSFSTVIRGYSCIMGVFD